MGRQVTSFSWQVVSVTNMIVFLMQLQSIRVPLMGLPKTVVVPVCELRDWRIHCRKDSETGRTSVPAREYERLIRGGSIRTGRLGRGSRRRLLN